MISLAIFEIRGYTRSCVVVSATFVSQVTELLSELAGSATRNLSPTC